MSEQTEEEYLIERLSKLLAEISVIVNGPQPMGVLWSYADLPEKVQALKDSAPQPQPQAEPVAWQWRVNGVHPEWSDVEPPEDAYDKGTLVPLYDAPQPQPVAVAWDDWIDRCHFWVTFDGETTHQLTFGGYTADANGINSMTFELSGIVSRDDLDELDDAIDEAMRVADTGADRARIKEAYARIRPLLSELATGDLR